MLVGLRGRLQVAGVLVVGRRDHHGVDVLHLKDLAVRAAHLGVAAEPLLRLGLGFFAGLAPRIGDRDDLDVGGGGMLVNARHVGRDPAAAAADLGDADAGVGADGAGALGGGEITRGGGRQGRAGGEDGRRLGESARRNGGPVAAVRWASSADHVPVTGPSFLGSASLRSVAAMVSLFIPSLRGISPQKSPDC